MACISNCKFFSVCNFTKLAGTQNASTLKQNDKSTQTHIFDCIIAIAAFLFSASLSRTVIKRFL